MQTILVCASSQPTKAPKLSRKELIVSLNKASTTCTSMRPKFARSADYSNK